MRKMQGIERGGYRQLEQMVRHTGVRSWVVRHRVLGIKDSSKTVESKSDSGRQEVSRRQ